MWSIKKEEDGNMHIRPAEQHRCDQMGVGENVMIIRTLGVDDPFKLWIKLGKDSVDIPVDYCPFCGSKLKTR